jgi:hypothetical protein
MINDCTFKSGGWMISRLRCFISSLRVLSSSHFFTPSFISIYLYSNSFTLACSFVQSPNHLSIHLNYI